MDRRSIVVRGDEVKLVDSKEMFRPAIEFHSYDSETVKTLDQFFKSILIMETIKVGMAFKVESNYN